VFPVVHRLINWKVLKTLLFPVFKEFRAIPQAEVRILKDFKSNVFGSADCKRVAGAFCGSADSTGFNRFLTAKSEHLGRREPDWGPVPGRASSRLRELGCG
jgi:hypothetical protein